jgi:lactate dehydrogenase-like 2-hydroxyacid dehydrogenase
MPNQQVAVIAKIPADLRAALDARFAVVDALTAADQERLGRAGCKVVVTTSVAGASTALMDAFPALRLIACNGAGLDRIDMATAASRGIVVRNTSDELTEDTADFAIALLYAVARKVVEADRFVRDGRWLTERMAVSQRVGGKTAGIVGLGKIGQVVAQRAAGIGMRVLYHGRRPKADVPYRYVDSLAAMAREVDVLILCCPGGEETKGLVNGEILALLGKDGILINIARGSVVDEPALIAALEAKTIYGAGLDVFATEPALNPAFLTLQNAVLAPHYASLTAETRQAIIKTLSEAIAAHLGA